MSMVITITVATAVVLAFFGFDRRRPASSGGPSARLDLRRMAPTSPPGDFGSDPEPQRAWAIIMDTTYANGSASLLSLADGSASLYFSTGGGVIGGHAHPDVNSAAKSFVADANRQVSQLSPARDISPPKQGKTRFYVRTRETLFTAEAEESDLGSGKHPLSRLFFAGQEVITQLRVISENAK